MDSNYQAALDETLVSKSGTWQPGNNSVNQTDIPIVLYRLDYTVQHTKPKTFQAGGHYSWNADINNFFLATSAMTGGMMAPIEIQEGITSSLASVTQGEAPVLTAGPYYPT